MKNVTALAAALLLMTLVVLGCGSINPFSEKQSTANSNKTLTDKGIDTVIGEETTGVPECDEVMDMIAAEANNPDDGYVVKAVKGVFLNRLKEGIRKAVEDSKKEANGVKDLTKTCTDFKKQLIKYKEEEAKKNAK